MIANPNDGNTPKVEQAVPKISVSAAGLITATAEQQEGYVPGGTKSATHQLTTQGAKTVTPGRTAQSAVASGYYTTGEVQVAGDANLVPENIAEGVSIFGVTGTHSGGGLETVTGQVIAGGFGSQMTIAWSDGERGHCLWLSGGISITITVLKNSVVYVDGADSVSGDAIKYENETMLGAKGFACFVNGPFTINY